MKKDFIINDVLGFGWRVMKSNIGFFVEVILIYGVIFLGIAFLRSVVEEMSDSAMRTAILIPLGLIEQVIGIILGIGMIKIALSFCDQVRPKVGTLFDGFDCFWRYIGTGILYSLIIFGGMLLLIVPGIIWAVKFQYGYYFVVDRGLGPIAALKASARATQGVKMKLFGFGLLCGLINIAGMICLVIGLFATIPTVMIAMALVYRHLMMQTPELAEFGIQCNLPELAVNGIAPQQIELLPDQGEEKI